MCTLLIVKCPCIVDVCPGKAPSKIWKLQGLSRRARSASTAGGTGQFLAGEPKTPHAIHWDKKEKTKSLKATDLYNDASQILLTNLKLNTIQTWTPHLSHQACFSPTFIISVNDSKMYRVVQARKWEPPSSSSSRFFIPKTSSLQAFEISPSQCWVPLH